MTTYAIADIHGYLALLERALAWIGQDRERKGGTDDEVVFLGDYVDRGPDARGVVERVMAGPDRPGERWIALRGNHEQMMSMALRTPGSSIPGRANTFWNSWRQNGGIETLASYGIDADVDAATASAAFPEDHLRYLDALPLTHDTGTHLFVHAGINPRVPLREQSEGDLLWIRTPFLTCGEDLGRVVVHGHTIESDMPRVRRNRIGLDTGAYHTGRLSVAAIDGNDLRFALVTASGTNVVRPRMTDFYGAEGALDAAP